MTKDEEIRIINEKLDFYVMEASDEEFDTEEVRKLVKQLDGLGACPCYTTVTRTPKRKPRHSPKGKNEKQLSVRIYSEKC